MPDSPVFPANIGASGDLAAAVAGSLMAFFAVWV